MGTPTTGCQIQAILQRVDVIPTPVLKMSSSIVTKLRAAMERWLSFLWMIPIPACLRDLKSWILKAASLPSISIHLLKMAALPNHVNTGLPTISSLFLKGSTGAQDAEEHTCPVAPVDRSGGQQKYQEADGIRYPERSGI